MTARPRAPWLDRLVYRLTAPVYDRLARSVAPGRQWAADELGLGPDDRVLLLGCGTGLDLEYLPADCSVVAVDRSERMVTRCRRRGTARGIEFETRVGDARSVASPDGSFDAVLLHLLLSVTADPGAIVSETARLLAAGGRVSILDEPSPLSGGSDEDSLADRLGSAGLEKDRHASFPAGYSAAVYRDR